MFPPESVIIISEDFNVKSAKSAEYTAPSIMKSKRPSPSTSEAAGEVKIRLSFCRPSSLISHRESLAPPPSPPSLPSKA